MAECAACGARVEEGLTRCPNCGAKLTPPGSFLVIGGWVVFFMSSIPVVVGIICAEQGSYIPLALGVGLTVAGIVMIITGHLKSSRAPDLTRPSPVPSTSPSSPSAGSSLNPSAGSPPR